MPNPTCVIEGCDKPARSAKADWCKMHYHRWYRHGDVNKAGPPRNYVRKYRSVYEPHHPLAMANGKVYVHRYVLFSKIGPGEHSCHWCGQTVVWTAGQAPDMLVADHLDGEGDNNSPDNLVPSCPYCNITRGRAERLVRLRAAGWWSNHDTVGQLGRKF